MPKQLDSVNTSATESGANTLKYENIEVGASHLKGVLIRGLALNVQAPDSVASTTTEAIACLRLGKHAPTTIANLSHDGVIAIVNEVMTSDATPQPVNTREEGPFTRDGLMISVPRDVDGKFYVTLMVKGVSNTAAKTGKVRLELLKVS